MRLILLVILGIVTMAYFPESRRFPEWLASTFDFGGGTDPWGGQYVIYDECDSFAVVSFGPDRLPGTGEDVRIGVIKAWARRR